ncbi:Multicopper oxidase, type 3 [Cordyceps fumosorosea ARSEF 2679]|uniref:Multicopper oxidase, type 3 n=1 Tax=Cordyceps fumosorosea (strain ARSEF 2679) TaxID=1081104 RepID=A0A167LJR5_CORFA|nr:Multicopper oxidase, type 3 [Cordyceps fumosorosea ARSEF 2679]OAA53169.1 Multicopper oxidase, type 3 [Cordyceps fumosorosea ARSEF 2679]
MNLVLPFFFLFALAICNNPRSVCSGNTAGTRSQWCDYSIDTNYYDHVPDTGVVREYHFDLQQITASPDGFSRIAYAFNGMVPGPTIEADWGDTVVVHVSNNLTLAQNGTSIHFHGIRQNYTNEMDGVTAITQCPVHAGGSMTYKWRATQYGTSWYHSHIGLQAWDGASGAIRINGPTTANYDVDKGTILLSDWTHPTASSLYSSALTNGPPFISNGLINGTNTWNNSGTVVGNRFSTSFEAGKSYRFGLINGALDTHFKFTIDNHTMTVIAADFVPIVPYQTTVLDIAIGQRYDIVVTADQQSVADNFWMRALVQTTCSNNDNPDDIRGIIHYGSEISTPTTSVYDYVDGCIDEPVESLVPHVALSAGTSDQSNLEQVSILNSDGVFLWALNNTSFYADWANPTLLQVYNNATNFTTRSHVIQLDQADSWVYVIIEATNGAAHPIHLHGHDFYIVAQGSGSFDSSTDLFSLTNPMRRDVAMLPGSGHLVLAFKTDNPGAWLMHCHIGWHTNMGLALQFVERQEEARKLINYDFLNDTCAGWKEYATLVSLEQEIYDDGI